MPGPPPKPVHVKARDGNPGKRPLPEIARLAPLEAVPEPPDGLGEAGGEAWRLVGESMARGGALQAHYLPLMFEFAYAVDLATRARRLLEDEPLVKTGRGGGKHPAFSMWRDAVKMALALGARFGATPSDMAQLGISAVRGLSLQEELRARKAAKA